MDGSGAVDFSYLEGFCAGDEGVVVEILTVFLEQARIWSVQMDAPGTDWRTLAHTIKGSAKGIGANALGEAASQGEQLGSDLKDLVRAELAEAVAAIEGYLARIGGG